MAVVASFTAVPSGGLIPPSEDVQFTDTSTGSPDNWLWDFGDGEISNEQNPLHTFTGSIGQIFTVKLTAWIGASSLTISLALVSPKFEKTPGFVAGTNAGAFGLFDPPNFSTTGQGTGPTKYEMNHFLNGNFAYAAIRETRSITLPASPSGGGPSVFLIEANLFDYSPGNNIGTVISDIGGTISHVQTTGVWHAFFNMTGLIGTTFEALFTPTNMVAMPDGPADSASGINLSFRGREYTTAGGDDIDEVEGAVAFGTAPVADFTGDPIAGKGSVSVQFENLTTEAVGIPTTYSWKRKLSGTADPFVEFSTDKNPLETFTK